MCITASQERAPLPFSRLLPRTQSPHTCVLLKILAVPAWLVQFRLQRLDWLCSSYHLGWIGGLGLICKHKFWQERDNSSRLVRISHAPIKAVCIYKVASQVGPGLFLGAKYKSGSTNQPFYLTLLSVMWIFFFNPAFQTVPSFWPSHWNSNA